MRNILIVLFVILSAFLLAQDSANSSSGFFKTLAQPDSASGSTVKVFQDNRITASMADRKTLNVVSSGTGQGFRIQVFSSNVQKTAKAEAFKVEKEIRSVFPELGVYVSYISPFWKVRVGDFKTSADAQDFRPQLIEAFPQLKNAIYTVKEKINY
ncbi:MAG: SPOR domain-containing protein [Paludibacter sp.]